jgi:hypothetical protein
METEELQQLFERERDDLSTRSRNILIKLGIFDFDKFYHFTETNEYPYDFSTIKNCGVYASNEINNIIRLIRKEKIPEVNRNQTLFSDIESYSIDLKETSKETRKFINRYQEFFRDFDFDNLVRECLSPLIDWTKL